MLGLRGLRFCAAANCFRRAQAAVLSNNNGATTAAASAASTSRSTTGTAPVAGFSAASTTTKRFYTVTSIALEEEAATKRKRKELTPEEIEERRAKAAERKHHRRMAQDYNNRRAAYKRQVSVLRKQYAEEYARWKKEMEAAKSTEQEKITRKRLERQRRKNIRSAQNALRQEELRQAREKEFNEHLERQQIIREAQEERFRRARQLVVDELEKEAPLWLTTPEEVEAAFTHESEQLLWTRPGGVIGAPNPSTDAHFWQFQAHAQDFRRTYPLMRDVFLEDMEEEAYLDANVDANFWTPERVEEHEKMEEKARLRAMVQTAGRNELLRKQRQFIEADADEALEDESAIGQLPAVPSMKVLHDKEALEREGASLLLKDPTRFFHFEESEQDEAPEEGDDDEYEGPTLGAPVRLRDPVRDNTPDGNPWPRIIGKVERPDTRTEREKKQEERNIRLMEAAEAAEKAQKLEAGGGAIEVDLEREENIGDEIDYDTRPYDSDEEEWFKGLDPEKDADIMNIPAERRYTEDDFAFVVDKLEGKVEFFEQELKLEFDSLRQEILSNKRMMAESSDEEIIEEGSVEAAFMALSDQELVALSDLDEAYSPDMPREEFEAFMKDIPGLTEEQLLMVLSRDREK